MFGGNAFGLPYFAAFYVAPTFPPPPVGGADSLMLMGAG